MDYGFASERAVSSFVQRHTLAKVRDKPFKRRFYMKRLYSRSTRQISHYSIMLYIGPTILRGFGLPVEGNMTIAERKGSHRGILREQYPKKKETYTAERSAKDIHTKWQEWRM